MSRSVIVGLVGAAILLIAILLNLWSNPDPVDDLNPIQPAPEETGSPGVPVDPDPAQPVPSEAPIPATPDPATPQSAAPLPAPDAENRDQTPDPSATPPQSEPQPDQQSEPQAEQQPAEMSDQPVAEAQALSAQPVRPTFDIVRIDPSGDAVIAGRAEPGSTVTMIDTGTEIGKVESDSRGEWVFLPTTPLTPGPHELRLRSELSDGTILMGEGSVVLVVPKPGEDIAGRETSAQAEPQQPLVVLIPDEDRVGADLIQAPTSTPSDQSVTENTAPAAALSTTTTAEQSGVLSDDGSMGVETIDYDSLGNISIAGNAPRDTTVIAYLDGSPIGSGTVDQSRKWRISPDQEITPGVYRLRLDALKGDEVVARIEIPFSRAAPIADLEGDAFIVVQPGNSLWRIARRTLGSGVNFTVIYEANEDQIRDPDLIYPGQVFEIPRE